MFYSLKRSARGLKKMGAIDFVTTLAPGLRDVLLTGKVKEAVTRTDADGHHAYDAVVLDAPPTGRIAKFLDATKEVANLTKFGPINRQSEGVIDAAARHADRGAPRDTARGDAGAGDDRRRRANCAAADFRLGAVIVNRARPDAGRTGQSATVGRPTLLTAGLRSGATCPPRCAEPLAREMTDYADRQRVQAENAARLDDARPAPDRAARPQPAGRASASSTNWPRFLVRSGA